jgi:type II restriction enzyme
MSKKHDLRTQRTGTVINSTSKRQEKALDRALVGVQKQLKKRFPWIHLEHQQSWLLADVVSSLSSSFPTERFVHYHPKSAMRPDGGILSMRSKDGRQFTLLIAEKKNQGTNDLRKHEGKPRQAQGNAIERLGKNVIGFRTALMMESIFPFVCFGDGCDFADDSSILDRVVTIAMFGELNQEHLHNSGPDGCFNRGSFFFREAEWTEAEMLKHCAELAKRSVLYYLSKYGSAPFGAE